MGLLHYGEARFAFDDRSLAHLQIVVSTKLRRAERFFLSWNQSSESGDERIAVWIDNGVQIYFQYSSTDQPSINRRWIEEMLDQANSSAGVHLTQECDSEES